MMKINLLLVKIAKATRHGGGNYVIKCIINTHIKAELILKKADQEFKSKEQDRFKYIRDAIQD